MSQNFLNVTGGIGVGVKASDPSPAKAGDFYYNSASNVLRFYNGSAWVTLASSAITGSGTTGTIPKFTGSAAIGDSVIQEASSNIGIGKSPTLGKLDVNGGVAADSLLFGSSSNLLYQSATETATLRIGTSPSYLNFTNVSGAPMVDAPSGTLWFGTSGTARARISPNGYLGIGGDPEIFGINTAIYAKSAFGSPTGGVPYGGIWISSTDTAAINKGGVLSLGGSYTGTSDTRFAAIAGLKENATDGDYGGYFALYTRPNGGSPLERMVVSSAGNVTINTAASGSSLIVGGSAPSAGTATIVSGSGAIALGISDNINSSLYIRPAAGGTVIGTDSGGVLRFAAGGNTTSDVKVELSATGNLGIGCSPNQKLEIQGSSGVTQRIGTTTSSFYIQHNGTSDTHIYTGDAADLRLGTNSTERLKITSAGEIITSATGGTSGSGSPAIASGTYTPTASDLSAGISGVTPRISNWLRVGNIVIVHFAASVTVTSGGSFYLTVPTTTANFSSTQQAHGVLGYSGFYSGHITSVSSTQKVVVYISGSGTIEWGGTFSYQVQ